MITCGFLKSGAFGFSRGANNYIAKPFELETVEKK